MEKQLNLFIAGYGTVGKALVGMIMGNREAIARRTGKVLRICGLANSRRYLVDASGIEASRLGEGVAGSFAEALDGISLPGSVFVDCTASRETGPRYIRLMQAGYSVVACNKIPFSGDYRMFSELTSAAAREGAGLRFETTVGAALPVLSTLDRIVASGDRLVSVEAVLSGTLNYLCDRYAGRGFGALVEDARLKGYTEPDPAVDLSGRDVLRKTLILSRVAGVPLEESDVLLESFPGEPALGEAYLDAVTKGLRLRYVASLRRDGAGLWQASVGLKAVGPESPLYSLAGTDNCAVITTSDYPSPLVIRGAGAGPRQTAGGLLQDILSL